jgi:hypothetical protein
MHKPVPLFNYETPELISITFTQDVYIKSFQSSLTVVRILYIPLCTKLKLELTNLLKTVHCIKHMRHDIKLMSLQPFRAYEIFLIS